jgi:hypothetical protein
MGLSMGQYGARKRTLVPTKKARAFIVISRRKKSRKKSRTTDKNIQNILCYLLNPPLGGAKKNFDAAGFLGAFLGLFFPSSLPFYRRVL